MTKGLKKIADALGKVDPKVWKAGAYITNAFAGDSVKGAGVKIAELGSLDGWRARKKKEDKSTQPNTSFQDINTNKEYKKFVSNSMKRSKGLDLGYPEIPKTKKQIKFR